jgi:hypothetical protein
MRGPDEGVLQEEAIVVIVHAVPMIAEKANGPHRAARSMITDPVRAAVPA